MKLQKLQRSGLKNSRNMRRFFTQIDMATIKHDEAVLNSVAKRAGLKRVDSYIRLCGCGVEGCFIHPNHNRPAPFVASSLYSERRFRGGRVGKLVPHRQLASLPVTQF